jgi:nucleoside-diphosphate-sugar epimerase
MKVIVTGGTGFIGQYVCEELNRCGHHVIQFDRNYRELESISFHKGDIFFGDVMDSVAVTEAFAHGDAFIHLAAVLGTQETIQNPLPAARSNLLGGLNVLQAAAQYDLPGVYIGVGNHWMNNTYSITKTMIERFVSMYNNDRGTCVNIVRAMNAYGPRQVAAPPYGPGKVRKIAPAFICRALYNDDIEIYGDGTQVSDMVHVRDVAMALCRALESAADGRHLPAIEVGPAKSKTVNEIAQTIIDIAESKSVIKHIPMRPGEIPNSVVNASTEHLSLIGLDPAEFISLEEGMTETIDYFRHKLGVE